MAELERVRGGGAVDTSPYVEFGERHLAFREDTPYEVWEAVVVRLKSAERSIQWWIGDALRFGEGRYGERYAQALEETDYTYGALANMAYIAGRIESSRRREKLTFSHHAEVAPLPRAEQDEILDEAEKNGLTVSQTRERKRERETPRNVETIELVRCPECGCEYPLSRANTRTEAVWARKGGPRGRKPEGA